MSSVEPLIVTLHGEWDVYRREELRAALLEAYDEPYTILDLSAVTYADSTILSELVHMRKHRLARVLPSPVLVLSGMLLHVLTITQMQDLWPHYPSLQQALQAGKSAVCESTAFDRS